MWKKSAREKKSLPRPLRAPSRRSARASERPSVERAPESPARDDDGIFFFRAVFFSVASIVQSRSKRPKKSRAQGSDARRLGAVPTPRGRPDTSGPPPADASEHVTVDVTIFEKIFCEDDFAHRTVGSMWKKFAREKNRYLDRYVLRRDVTVARASEPRAPDQPATTDGIFFFGKFLSPLLRLCKVGPNAQGSDARDASALGAVPTAAPTPRASGLGRRGRPTDASEHVTVDVTIFRTFIT